MLDQSSRNWDFDVTIQPRRWGLGFDFYWSAVTPRPRWRAVVGVHVLCFHFVLDTH